MSEFHVTPEMAQQRVASVQAAGKRLGLESDLFDVARYAPGDRDAFAEYLDDAGIQFFSVTEVVTPNHRAKAAQAGFTELVPPLHLWPWALLVLRLGDLMREQIGRPIRLRNLYRPMSYNRLVASSGITSDHPNACAGDFDFSNQSDRRTAEQLVREISRTHPDLQISLGMGARSLHVGTLSPKGRRCWFYDSYPDERVMLE